MVGKVGQYRILLTTCGNSSLGVVVRYNTTNGVIDHVGGCGHFDDKMCTEEEGRPCTYMDETQLKALRKSGRLVDDDEDD